MDIARPRERKVLSGCAEQGSVVGIPVETGRSAALALGPPREKGHAALWAPLGAVPGLLDNPAERDFVRRLTG